MVKHRSIIITLILTCVFLADANSLYSKNITVVDYSFEKESFPDPSFQWSKGKTLAQIEREYIHAYKLINGDQESVLSEANLLIQGEFKLEERPLIYPNPFRLAEGAEIGLVSSDDMDVNILFYDMIGTKIATLSQVHLAEGYTAVLIDKDTFGYNLPVSAYFFLVTRGGKVLGKGKFVVRP